MISSKGTQAVFTDTRPDDYKGHLVGKDMVVAGNILVGRETLEAMAAAFDARNIDLRIDSSKDPVGDLPVLFDAYKAAFKIK